MHALTAPIDHRQRTALTNAGAEVFLIGHSLDGQDLYGYCIGEKHLPLVSIVAGAHPDEPAGPLAALKLAQLRQENTTLQQLRFAVVPIMDIDGARDQQQWLDNYSEDLDILAYLEHRLRRLPGADREFAWPGAPWDGTVLPESQAANDFLDLQGPAIAHLSLHGMGIAHGAWFLLDHLALQDDILWKELRALANAAGLGLHDGPRYGDKGFRRCAAGFCTTPSGSAMRRWALRENKNFANEFAFSSMDAARMRARLAGITEDNLPLCAVSEFPLITLPFQETDAWKEELLALPFSTDKHNRLEQLSQTYNIRSVPLSVQVHGMLHMVIAVSAAAMRKIFLETRRRKRLEP